MWKSCASHCFNPVSNHLCVLRILASFGIFFGLKNWGRKFFFDKLHVCLQGFLDFACLYFELFFCIVWYRSADHHQEQEWPAVIHCNFLASTGALWLWTTMQQMQRCLAIDRCDTWLLVTCFFWLFAMLNTFFSCSQSVQYLILLSLGSQSVHYLSLVTCV